MPKTNNKGFGGLPVLILMLSLSVLSFVGYQYYSSLNKPVDTAIEEVNSEDVLQANSNSVPKDLNTFFFRNYFGSENLAEFNKGTEPLIISMEDGFTRCFFAQRSAKPTDIKYTLNGKTYSARVFQKVTFLAITNDPLKEAYTVIIPLANAPISFSEDSGVVKTSCGPNPNIYVVGQPSNEITQQNFSQLLGVKAQPQSASIEIKEKGRGYVAIVNPNGNIAFANTIRKNGVSVQLADGKKVVIKSVICQTQGCDKSFQVDLPYTKDNGTPDARRMTQLTFPKIDNSTVYEISWTGKPLCEGSMVSGNAIRVEDNVVYFNTYCMIG